MTAWTTAKVSAIPTILRVISKMKTNLQKIKKWLTAFVCASAVLAISSCGLVNPKGDSIWSSFAPSGDSLLETSVEEGSTEENSSEGMISTSETGDSAVQSGSDIDGEQSTGSESDEQENSSETNDSQTTEDSEEPSESSSSSNGVIQLPEDKFD